MKLKEYPQHLRNQLAKTITTWSEKQGIPDKVSALNQRANAHPKRTALVTMVIALSLILLTSIPLLFTRTPETDSLDFASIEATAPPRQAAQKIEAIKALQASSIHDYLSKGQTLKRELDSLLALPHKSSRDSLEIIRKHKQLEYIVNNLNEKD